MQRTSMSALIARQAEELGGLRAMIAGSRQLIAASRGLLERTAPRYGTPLDGSGPMEIRSFREEMTMQTRTQTRAQPDPIVTMRNRLASLDARIVHLRALQQEGDNLAARLADHVERERGEISRKLKAIG
jgi:hypothetical protein